MVQNDSDSDDDLPVTKKQKKVRFGNSGLISLTLDFVSPQSGGSGLTALLPEPKGGAKELGSGKRSTSSTKTMVPYTLSKRYQDSKKKSALKKGKPVKKSSGGGEDSDSDGEAPVSFFSLDDSTQDPKSSSQVLVSSDPIQEPGPTLESSTEQNEEPHHSLGPSLPEQYSYSDYYSTYSGANEQYAVINDPSVQGYPSQYSEVSQQYSNVNKADTSSASDVSAVGPGLSIDEEQVS